MVDMENSYKCTKCGGKTHYKKLTVKEYNNKFLLTIIECKYCRYWEQLLKVDLNQFNKDTTDFRYDHDSSFLLPGDISKKFIKGLDFNDYKNILADKKFSDLLCSLNKSTHSLSAYSELFLG